MKIVIASGYFNPIHEGHIEYLNNAKTLGDKLFVIVNNDHQRALKGSKEFQLEGERCFIVQNIKACDMTILSIDQDRTVIETIKYIVRLAKKYDTVNTFAFVNGGDQTNQSIPEAEICNQLGIDLIDGLGNKIQSSSWLLAK
jgi:cytidyltransferase-like protein